jgi:hypothetical protein
MRPKYEVADVFRQYGAAYKETHYLRHEEHKAMAAITACRTSQLGGHTEVCSNCATIRNSYNSCRNRHCPKCQTMTKEKWLDNRKAELLPCGYFHLVFTLPHDLNPLILANRKELLKLLFMAVKQTLVVFAADPQWRLKGQPGFMLILHTWSQTLIDHFHIHCLIPGGALSFDKTSWHKSSDNFLFKAESLAKEFKKQYLTMLHKQLDSLSLPEDSQALLQKAKAKQWVGYAKKPFAGAKQVLEYLGRYTHRVAIANHRIKDISNGVVTFTYKDRKNNTTEEISLPATEFIRRFLLHVLPKGFMKIRYYGFLANINKKKAVLLIRRLIGVAMEIGLITEETLREKLLRLTGKDIQLCPHCGYGQMIVLQPIPALNSS